MALLIIVGLSIVSLQRAPKALPRDGDGWLVPVETTQEPSSACQAAGFAAYNQCRVEFNDQWYDGGALDDPKKEKVRDYARCARVEHAAYDACAAR